MIKELEKSYIVEYSCEDYPWARFGLNEDDMRYNEDAFVQKMYPHVVGWCKGNSNGSERYVLCEVDYRGKFWFPIKSKIIKTLKRWDRHVSERIQDGVSYRDAWNVDSWLADKCAKILKHLEKDTISFPGECVKDFHEKALAVEGKKLEMTEEEKKLSTDDLCVKWYHEDLKRMIFLFNEYDDEKCTQKNQYKFELEMVHKKKISENGKEYYTIEFEGTPEQKEEADRYNKRLFEIEQYQIDCLHKAIAIMNIYIIHLWD